MADSNNLVILMFEGLEGASAAYAQLEQMEKDKQLTIADAIIIERDANNPLGDVRGFAGSSGQGGGAEVSVPNAGVEQVRVIQTHSKKGKYAASGGGIGLLVGMLFGGPIGGLIVGAGVGAITAAMKDFGIDDKSIELVKARLQPGTSALLVLGQASDRDAFVNKLRSFNAEVISTSLTPEAEKELRTRLSE